MAVNFRIYGGSAGSGPAGSLGIKSVSMSVISSADDTLATSLIGKPGLPVPGRRIMPYKVDFDKPVQITSPASGFFAAIELPHMSPSDKLAIFSDTKTNSSHDSTSWFRNFFGTWRTFKQNRGADVHLAIIPHITCSQLTGISDFGGLQQHQVTLMPNPGSGEFMLIFSLPQEESRVTVRVLNSVGQQVAMDELREVKDHIALLDMTQQAPGIYFAEISDGQRKIVKKIVLTR